MEAQELRIGNIVTHNGVEFIVYGISGPHPMGDKRFSDKCLVELSGGGLITVLIEDIFPVQLTEEWLLKLGFTVNNSMGTYGDEEYLVYSNHIYVVDYKGGFYLWLECKEDYFYNAIGAKIEAVHHLQNLCFALTGEELILKLDLQPSTDIAV